MSRNAQNPQDEEPLLPPLTISQILTRVSLLACIGVGTIMFLKSQMVARQHLARTTKVAETIADGHRQATDRLVRENERGVQRIVEVLRENQWRQEFGKGGGGMEIGGADRAKMEGVRFEDEYGKWNGYTRNEAGGRKIGEQVHSQWARFKDKCPCGVGKQDRKAEGVWFQDHYGL